MTNDGASVYPRLAACHGGGVGARGGEEEVLGQAWRGFELAWGAAGGLRRGGATSDPRDPRSRMILVHPGKTSAICASSFTADPSRDP